MNSEIFEKQKKELTPDEGFNLVGVDYFGESGEQLYIVKHFESYQNALNEKKDKKNPDEYFILYKDTSGEFLCR